MTGRREVCGGLRASRKKVINAYMTVEASFVITIAVMVYIAVIWASIFMVDRLKLVSDMDSFLFAMEEAVSQGEDLDALKALNGAKEKYLKDYMCLKIADITVSLKDDELLLKVRAVSNIPDKGLLGSFMNGFWALTKTRSISYYDKCRTQRLMELGRELLKRIKR